MLLPDEHLVIDWLSEYGALKHKQLKGLLSHKPMKTVERFLYLMSKRTLLFSPPGTGYVGLDNLVEHDDRVVLAVWVLLKFHVEPQNHYRAGHPSQIYFVKGVFSYEICVIRRGDEYLTKLLRPREKHKFVLIIEDEEQISMLDLPDSDCLFALVRDRAESSEPDISFIQQGEIYE